MWLCEVVVQIPPSQMWRIAPSSGQISVPNTFHALQLAILSLEIPPHTCDRWIVQKAYKLLSVVDLSPIMNEGITMEGSNLVQFRMAKCDCALYGILTNVGQCRVNMVRHQRTCGNLFDKYDQNHLTVSLTEPLKQSWYFIVMTIYMFHLKINKNNFLLCETYRAIVI